MSETRVQVLLSVIELDKEEGISLEGSAFVFGRSTKSDVYINDPCMSRSHFKFFTKSNELWIADLGSANGTYVNDQKVGSNSTALIHPGDVLTIESSTTRIVIKQIKFPNEEVALAPKNDREDITSIINKIIEDANAKAEDILANANRHANEAGRLAKDLAMAEFSDEIRAQLVASEKIKIEAQRDLELKAIQAEHAKQKAELLSSLVGLDRDLADKKQELATLSQDVEIKKQKILEELDREHSERMNSYKESHALQAAEVEKVKQEITKLESLHETKRAEQLKLIEVEVENRKNELQAEVLEYDQKLSASKREFAKLYDTYELKKTEQVEVVNELLKNKESLVSEIKKLENLVSQSRDNWEEQSEKTKQSAASFQELLAEHSSVEKKIASLKLESSNEKKLIEDKLQEIQLLNLEIETIKKNKEEMLPLLETQKEEAKKLKTKIDIASVQAANIDNEHKQRLIDLEKNHLEAKKNYQDEMVKLKESEEKRLQQQLREEMARVSKLKEESLRLVIDLEDSITKEISIATSKIFASTIGASKYSEIAPQFEKSIRTSLQTGVLKLLKNDLDPNSKNVGLSGSKQGWKPVAVGMGLSAVIFGFLPYVYKEVQMQTDPVQQQLRLEAEHEAKALIPVPKFTPEKVKTLGSTFVNSVNHTEDFCETYAQEEFRSKLIKEGSVYLYKNWQIDEEKSIESYAIMFSLIDALKQRRESVNPEFEKRDVAKMVLLEHETMKKVEKLLGNGVRVEAALKFQARFYNDFVAHNSSMK